MHVEDIVCRTLLEHGAYAPAELLLAADALSREGYDAWRTGDGATLDEVIGDLAAARATLREAAAFARNLGLVEDALGPWLAVSGDFELDALLRAVWRPAGDERQGDLFRDNATTVTVNALRDALAARDAAGARRHRARLLQLRADHPAAEQGAALIRAIEAGPPAGPAEARDRRDRIAGQWMPAAAALLGAEGRDFLAPLWRDVGSALDGVPFDPDHPDRHASWAFRQCLDWEGVKRTVLAVPDFATYPILLGRLAEAELGLHERIEAVRLWFALCASAPSYFRELIRHRDFPDAGLAQAWLEAMDADELDGDLSAEWFPAWMLMREPGLARALPALSGSDGPARAFNLLRELRAADGRGEPVTSLRAALREVHAGLFATYMATRG